jgi:AraC-like DNA-binding protein
MQPKQTRSGGVGLERSCGAPSGDWIASAGPVGGVELLRAWFGGKAYEKHRHDTYAIGVTDSGVQVFDYRGAAQRSLAGQVVALHPDEAHDGRAGTPAGFGYRIVYVEPSHIAEALQALRGRSGPLPFVREVVSTNGRLARAIRRAFAAPLESLAVDGIILDLAEGLLAGEAGGLRASLSRRIDVEAVERVRQLLDAERGRVVHSQELEAISGLSRYELARQFRQRFGTSPYRYLLMRRLEAARRQIHLDRPLAEVAADAGFADQAHFTRVFKAALGLTPARYRALGTRRRG